MKTILLIAFIFISTAVSSQVYVIIDPAMRRAGLMYNQRIPERKLGIYGKCQYGVINVTDFYARCIKSGAGISIRLIGDAALYVGLNYNYYFDVMDQAQDIDLNLIEPVSIDVGFSSGDEMRLRLLFITDPFNWETSIGFSYRLKYHRTQTYEYGTGNKSNR
ncbi:MAG: hypothetical protein PHT07_21450 [Paludibacter sp.]|nr:hypothetical protein [Paludibacter sp.]